MHLLNRLAHRVARHGLADDSVGKPAVQRIAGVTRDLLAVDRVETAEVVKARNVVHVRVGERNGVDLGYAALYARETELRRRVDEKRRAVGRRNVCAAAPAAVARICRCADTARAADLRHSHGRARA